MFHSNLEETTGKLVLDSGASASMTSVVALEAYVKKMVEKYGSHEVRIDPEQKTRFRFGNGQCVEACSRARIPAWVAGKLGRIDLDCVDTKARYVPMLGSIEFLRRAGAIIDFERDEAVFTNIDPEKTIPLERSSSGHLMLDMTTDWFGEWRNVNEAARVPIRVEGSE